ncbi:MAG: DUF1573 domain-containing protein [Bacteroidales bacterium]
MKTNGILQSLVLTSIVAVLLVVASCGSNSGRENLPVDLIQNPNTAEGFKKDVEMPAFEFEKEIHDFGRVIQGEQVSFGFKFKNSGNALLLISSVSSSCGCTVASFPDKPLKPGEAGVITVSFDSRGRMGMQVKTVTILANTQPNTKLLMVRANIVVPETMNF